MMRRDVRLALLLLLFAASECDITSPPGKPVLLGCRSPEKETFTCWWVPGFNGGLPTMHRLFYERERLKGIHECPDYHSAGGNSCFFNKNHTSIWVDYYLSVVASNALGNTTSDIFKMDLMEIVKPDAPRNVSLLVDSSEESPSLHVSWEPPSNTDTKSGWVTLEYQLRVEQKDTNKWKEYKSGTQTHFTLYSVIPRVAYMVWVRCRLDHGSWSEWSNAAVVKIPGFQKEKPVWILVSTLSAIPFLAIMCVLVMNRKRVKQFLLPPVPGPKIRGVDIQLLKSGRSENIVNALIINQSFPSMMARKDQMEDYLIVCDIEDKFLLDASGSQRSRKSLIIPAGFHLKNQWKDPSSSPNDCEKTSKKDETDHFIQNVDSLSMECLSNLKLIQKQHCSSEVADMSPLNQDEYTPEVNIGYVDIQRHADNIAEADYTRVKEVNTKNILILQKDNIPGYMDAQRQADVPGDYSKVKEVNSDNFLFLQKQSESCDASRGDDDYTFCTKQKPRNLHVRRPSIVGVCTDLIDSGYVEPIPAAPSV
ncbi:prolactin receptor b [Aulostomus maculatus]